MPFHLGNRLPFSTGLSSFISSENWETVKILSNRGGSDHHALGFNCIHTIVSRPTSGMMFPGEAGSIQGD